MNKYDLYILFTGGVFLRRKGKERSVASGIFVGTGIGLTVMIAVTAVFAALISGKKVDGDIAPQAVMGAVFIGTFTGGLYAARNGRKLLNGILAGLLVAAFKLIISAFMHGASLFDSCDLGVMGCALAGGLAAGVLCSGQKNAGRGRKKFTFMHNHE